jgi:NAD-dependent deacetylase
MNALIQDAAAMLADAKQIVALTGAGISTESGIPPFRGPGGLWEKFDPMEYAHIDAFNRDPAKIWQVLLKEMIGMLDTAQPNAAHLGLARLEQLGTFKTVITQNVDGLHQRAGSTDVIEFHGNFAWLNCMRCDARRESQAIDLAELPPRCACGGIWRPECVFFGEMIPPLALARSQQSAQACDVMLVIGTSATVQPAAYLPAIAREAGARVIEFNPDPTPLTHSVSHLLLKGPAGEMMTALIDQLDLAD